MISSELYEIIQKGILNARHLVASSYSVGNFPRSNHSSNHCVDTFYTFFPSLNFLPVFNKLSTFRVPAFLYKIRKKLSASSVARAWSCDLVSTNQTLMLQKLVI